VPRSSGEHDATPLIHFISKIALVGSIYDKCRVPRYSLIHLQGRFSSGSGIIWCMCLGTISFCHAPAKLHLYIYPSNPFPLAKKGVVAIDVDSLVSNSRPPTSVDSSGDSSLLAKTLCNPTRGSTHPGRGAECFAYKHSGYYNHEYLRRFRGFNRIFEVAHLSYDTS
jgi:hypothetical protein